MRHRRLSYRLILQVHSFGKEVNPNSRLVGKKQNDVYTLGIYTWMEGGREEEGRGAGRGERKRERGREGGVSCNTARLQFCS